MIDTYFFLFQREGESDGFRVGQVSESWSQFLQLLENDEPSLIFKMPAVAMQILILIQKDLKVWEMDFLGAPLLGKVVDCAVHHVLQQPHEYANIIRSLDLLVTIQPQETFSTTTLNWVVAMVSLPEMGVQIKPMDLRVDSETLWHNLVKTSEKVKNFTPESLKLLTTLKKDIAPRLRLSVLRRLCDNDSNMALLLPHLTDMAIVFGSNCHPFLTEILSSNFNDATTEALSMHAGSILCAFFHKSVRVERQLEEKQVLVKMHCTICNESGLAVKNNQEDILSKIKSIFYGLLERLVGHSKAEVQINAIQNLIGPMSAHGLMDAQCASLWLHCLDSSNLSIAKKFSFQVDLLLKKGCNSSGGGSFSELEKVIIERLEECKMKAFKSRIDYHTLVCRCIDKLSQVKSTSDSFQQRLFDIGFDLLANTKTHIAASMIPKPLKSLMNAHPSHSTIKLAQVMCQAKSPKQVVDYATTTYRVNAKQFVEKQLSLLLTIVVKQSCSGEVKPVLDYLADLLDKRVRLLLVDNFPLIFSKLVTEASDSEEYQKCTKFLGDTIGFSIGELVQMDRQKLINELLVMLNGHTKRAFSAFSLIATHDTEFKAKLGSNKKITKQQLVMSNFSQSYAYFVR